MGCGDACPIYPGKRYLDWELEDPAGKDLETVRAIRDEIDAACRACSPSSSPAGLGTFAGRLAAEALGAFALVFFGAGAIMVDAEGGGLGQVGIAVAFGLAIATMIYALGHVSGAHFNPAVSFGFALTRHFPWSGVVGYRAAQVAGAVAAALLLRASLGDVANVGATVPSGSDRQAFLWEVVLTFFLMLVIMAVATDTRAVGEAARRWPSAGRCSAP